MTAIEKLQAAMNAVIEDMFAKKKAESEKRIAELNEVKVWLDAKKKEFAERLKKAKAQKKKK